MDENRVAVPFGEKAAEMLLGYRLKVPLAERVAELERKMAEHAKDIAAIKRAIGLKNA